MTEPMLKNGANKDEPKKAEPVVLSEEDSLRCENIDLKNQILQLNRRVFELEETIYALNEGRQKSERLAFLKKLGLPQDGQVVFMKRADGRYEVSTGANSEKK